MGATASGRVVLYFGTGGREDYDPTKVNEFYAVYADDGSLRTKITGTCDATTNLCEKFYGGVVVTSEQIILTRSTDRRIGTGTCDYGNASIQAFKLTLESTTTLRPVVGNATTMSGYWVRPSSSSFVDGQRVARLATVDRPDLTDRSQVHTIYFVPSDGPDNGLDVDGTLTADTVSAGSYLGSGASLVGVEKLLGMGLEIEPVRRFPSGRCSRMFHIASRWASDEASTPSVARPSSNAGESSHSGTSATRAVPLRIETFPPHLWTRLRICFRPCPRPGSRKRVTPCRNAACKAVRSSHRST